MIGKKLMEIQDIDGKACDMVRERVEISEIRRAPCCRR
jgi:hypothetical protein